jgi:hypothetical protein
VIEKENREANPPFPCINESELYPFAKECYELLKDYDHIGIMKEINQLGVIRKGATKNDGEDPTRDNYVAIQLSLIYRFKDSPSLGLGLASNVREISDNITAADVLQICVLLFNAGHLPGTFATERAILQCCKKNAVIKSLIRDGLPEDQFRNYFENICEEENIYAFHKILICFFLEIYKRDPNKSSLIDILQKSINYYEFGDDKKWEKLKRIFQRIRKLSFVSLDLHYALCPFNVDLSKAHSNIPEYLEELFKPEYDNPIIETLESLDDLLSKNVYLSAESNRKFAWHSKEIENKMENDKNRLINTNELYDYLKTPTNFNPKDIA